MNDRHWMTEAVKAARNARLHSRPNPWVGAIVVKDGVEVGRGWTSPPGGAHAEIHAIAESSRRARGATLYTTLEPCSHTGRTGPCADAIIEAGIARVVIGVLDPDQNVQGAGAERLRNAGVEVVVGVESEKVTAQLAPYLRHRTTGRPWVLAKMAVTADGAITSGPVVPSADRLDNDWITGSKARERVHELRAQSDAICVGAGTVRLDDPHLTVRGIEGRDPLRVVLGEVSPTASVNPCVQWTDGVVPLLEHLGQMGMIQLMVEGGQATLASFIENGLIDELVLHISSDFSKRGIPLFANTGWDVVMGWLKDPRVAVTSFGSDTEHVIPREVFEKSFPKQS